MSKFNIDDEVEIVSDRDYSITTVGSVGRIISIYGKSVSVEFTKLTSGYDEYIGNSFDIDISHIKLIKHLSREERVLDKVRLIHSRQLKRGIIHV